MDAHKTDYSNVRCFIDCDGTIANTFPGYNKSFDILMKGKLTDKDYVEYYREFNDAYDMVPGCPWKTLLANMVEFLSKPHEVSASVGSSRWTPAVHTYDIGKMDALIKVALNADFISWDAEREHAYYGGPGIGVVLSFAGGSGIDAEDIDLAMFDEYRVGHGRGWVNICCVLPEFSAHPIGFRVANFDFLYDVEALVSIIEDRFEEICTGIIRDIPPAELGIAPVIQFCREFYDGGGSLIVHSGSNTKIVEAVLETLDIRDIFEDILCSGEMEYSTTPAEGEEWGLYKVELLNKLLERYPLNGYKDFVLGDTKGDAYGAYRTSLPFFLVWRGYPASPDKLHIEGGRTLECDNWVDLRQEIIKARGNDAAKFRQEVDRMLAFADGVGRGACPVSQVVD